MAWRQQFYATWAATTRWWIPIAKWLQYAGKLSVKFILLLHLHKMKLKNSNLFLYFKLSAPASIPKIFQCGTWQSGRKWESISGTRHLFILLSLESSSWYSSLTFHLCQGVYLRLSVIHLYLHLKISHSGEKPKR